MSSARAENAISAPGQVSHPMNPRLSGSMTNWPNDPTAMVIPMARERCSADTRRLSVPNTTGKVVPDSPRPISTPAPRMNVASPATLDMIQSPAA